MSKYSKYKIAQILFVVLFAGCNKENKINEYSLELIPLNYEYSTNTLDNAYNAMIQAKDLLLRNEYSRNSKTSVTQSALNMSNFIIYSRLVLLDTLMKRTSCAQINFVKAKYWYCRMVESKYKEESSIYIENKLNAFTIEECIKYIKEWDRLRCESAPWWNQLP